MDWVKTPDSEGQWLWIELWSCGCCVMEVGTVHVVLKHDAADYKPDFEFENDLVGYKEDLSSRNYQPRLIAGWKKIGLPPAEWTREVWDSE